MLRFKGVRAPQGPSAHWPGQLVGGGHPATERESAPGLSVLGVGVPGSSFSVAWDRGLCARCYVIERGPPVLEIPALPATLPDTVAICKSLRGQVMTFA